MRHSLMLSLMLVVVSCAEPAPSVQLPPSALFTIQAEEEIAGLDVDGTLQSPQILADINAELSAAAHLLNIGDSATFIQEGDALIATETALIDGVESTVDISIQAEEDGALFASFSVDGALSLTLSYDVLLTQVRSIMFNPQGEAVFLFDVLRTETFERQSLRTAESLLTVETQGDLIRVSRDKNNNQEIDQNFEFELRVNLATRALQETAQVVFIGDIQICAAPDASGEIARIDCALIQDLL